MSIMDCCYGRDRACALPIVDLVKGFCVERLCE